MDEKINIFLNYYNRIYAYYCKENELLSSIVEKFKKNLEISDTRFRLTYNAKELDQNKALNELNLLDNCNIYVSGENNMKGGYGMKFVDLSKNIHEELYFSKTAPDYRIVSEGINVFGICKGKKCKAYKKEVIWPLKEKTTFNLIEEKDDLECPICGNLIIPKTLGFHYCEYLIKGKKCENDIITPFEFRDTASNKDSIRYFNPDENGFVVITELIVEVLNFL